MAACELLILGATTSQSQLALEGRVVHLSPNTGIDVLSEKLDQLLLLTRRLGPTLEGFLPFQEFGSDFGHKSLLGCFPANDEVLSGVLLPKFARLLGVLLVVDLDVEDQLHNIAQRNDTHSRDTLDIYWLVITCLQGFDNL